jgi:hypothetical protein
MDQIKRSEVVSKPQISFKGKAQADRESAAYMGVCEHLSETCNTAIGPQMGFSNHFWPNDTRRKNWNGPAKLFPR